MHNWKFNNLSVALLMLVLIMGFTTGCDLLDNKTPAAPSSTSGVKKATAKVKVQASGLTVEQENIKKRLEAENTPGAIKHLYIISAYSGQVILYSTVKGKVTSSGKRLSPYLVSSGAFGYGTSSTAEYGIPVNIGGKACRTSEVLQDDGTYGHSIAYLYWWDSKGKYHQHYITGGQIPHIADQPIAVKSIILNMEATVASSE